MQDYDMTTDKDINRDKRKHLPRFKIRYFTTLYLKDKRIYASAVDMNEEGLGLILQQDLPFGEILDLKLDCETSDKLKMEIKLKAKVIVTQGIAKGKIYRAGLQIIEVAEEDKENFKKHLQYLQNTSQG